MQLTLNQQFDLNKYERIIDNADKDQLKAIAKKMLKAWYVQRAAVDFVLKQKLSELQQDYYPHLNEQQSEGA
jgi:hypothetical protein